MGVAVVKPRINLITLGVEELERSLAFYRDGLGLESDGVVGAEFLGDETNPAGAIALFRLRGGVVLALYPRSELAKDAGVSFAEPKSGEFSIGQAVDSRAEVDEVLSKAAACGATVTDPPHERPWGVYSGYFQDLDGHLWEILHNPGFDFGED